jgi:hypothetical protein
MSLNKTTTRKNNESKDITQWRPLVDPDTGKLIPSIFSGGKSDSIDSKTSSLKDPNSHYSMILRILREKSAIGDNGLTLREITDEFRRIVGEEYSIHTVGAKLGRLAAKKLIIGRPKLGDAGTTLYSLYQ